MAAPINRNGGRKPRSPLTVALNQMRTKLWFDGLKLATGQTTAYGVGQKLLKADDKLFERYERGENSPTTTTVKVINHDFQGRLLPFCMAQPFTSRNQMRLGFGHACPMSQRLFETIWRQSMKTGKSYWKMGADLMRCLFSPLATSCWTIPMQ